MALRLCPLPKYGRLLIIFDRSEMIKYDIGTILIICICIYIFVIMILVSFVKKDAAGRGFKLCLGSEALTFNLLICYFYLYCRKACHRWSYPGLFPLQMGHLCNIYLIQFLHLTFGGLMGSTMRGVPVVRIMLEGTSTESMILLMTSLFRCWRNFHSLQSLLGKPPHISFVKVKMMDSVLMRNSKKRIRFG